MPQRGTCKSGLGRLGEDCKNGAQDCVTGVCLEGRPQRFCSRACTADAQCGDTRFRCCESSASGYDCAAEKRTGDGPHERAGVCAPSAASSATTARRAVLLPDGHLPRPRHRARLHRHVRRRTCAPGFAVPQGQRSADGIDRRRLLPRRRRQGRRRAASSALRPARAASAFAKTPAPSARSPAPTTRRARWIACDDWLCDGRSAVGSSSRCRPALPAGLR